MNLLLNTYQTLRTLILVKVSEPFSIEGKRYQMVEGISNKEKLWQCCHDELKLVKLFTITILKKKQ
jgi:hypothetical protein